MFSARALRLGTLTIAAALALGACNSAPALSDPTEILTKAIDAFQDAKTVHLAATLDGTFTMDLTGQGGGAMELTGTTLTGDVDIEHTKAKFTFAVPALLGLSGESSRSTRRRLSRRRSRATSIRRAIRLTACRSIRLTPTQRSPRSRPSSRSPRSRRRRAMTSIATARSATRSRSS